MNLTKFSLVGALALTLVACHKDNHEFCDWDNDGETDVGCVLVLKGVGMTLGAVALHGRSELTNDTIVDSFN